MTVEAQANATLPAAAKVNILMVDDQPANLLALEAILSDPSLNLIKAPSGERALELVREMYDIAVILLDVRMQGIDGFQTAQLIREQERHKHTPIMFLTAFEDTEGSVARAYSLGGVDYLVKPLIPAILRAKVAGFVELFRKTEQIKLQAELLRQRDRTEFESRLELVVDAIDLGLWYWDIPSGRLIWNEHSREQFGVGPDAEVTLDLFRGRVHPDDRARIRRAIDQTLAERTPYDVVFRVRSAGGQDRWIRAIGRAFFDDAGRPIHFDGISLDVTAQKRTEEALKDTDRRKDEFLAMLSHELRNPLAPLMNGLHLARRAEQPATRAEALDIMERQVKHLTHMVEDLLDVTRINRGKIQLNQQPLDLGHLVRTVARDRATALEQARLEVTVDVPTDPVWVSGDATRLTQVLNNLLHNAIKFTEAGGVIGIRLTTDSERGQAVVELTDTGIGIDPDMLPRLFEVFSQADRSLERARGGLGLGLAVVRGLAELHGGTVEAASDGPGRGARFRIRLPLCPAPEARDEAPAGPASARERLRVLIIEDNRDTADSLRRLLELLGHDVQVAYSGVEGVAAARSTAPDAVLCDIGLPGMNGYDVARAIRRQPGAEKVRLFAITGYGQDEDRRLSREAGFDFHLTKPVNPDMLVEILSHADLVS